ncbi:M48 family metallopeptidase [Stieleria sp. TO1_6]|uniref:M48 family metallopeptidase n=1 Tax=Stieleria tagensis TaxID=2956795 RepID=UPI00209B3A04|nr:M48 family metallopeptidase [Stieleria tagensis]MCO8123609.1 M48 family metallopeptidase [Stieleria tagensis]
MSELPPQINPHAAPRPVAARSVAIDTDPKPSRPAGSSLPSAAVRAEDHVTPGTKLHVLIGSLVGLGGTVVGLLVLTAVTFGVGLIGVLIAAIAYFFNQKKQRAIIDGSALKVGANQFPAIDKLVKQTAQRLGMTDIPDTYIYESSEQNAAAVKTKGKRVVLLTDDMIWGAMTTKDTKVLEFVIAHELAHHQLGHTGLIRSTITAAYKTLSRLDEFTCDAVASAVVNNPESSARAIALLAIGPQLLPKVNVEAMMAQAQSVVDNPVSKKAEKSLSHPLLLRRMARVAGVPMKC